MFFWPLFFPLCWLRGYIWHLPFLAHWYLKQCSQEVFNGWKRIIDWTKLPATELMQVLKEGLFLVGLVLTWSLSPAHILCPGWFCTSTALHNPPCGQTLINAVHRDGEQLYCSKRQHLTPFVAPFPTFVGCADESLALETTPWPPGL